MRITIKSLQEELKKANADVSIYKGILNQIHEVVFPGTTTYSHPYNRLPTEFMKLKMYQEMNQGSYRPEIETIHLLKEIVRWQVNPETAMESKVQALIDNNFTRR